jgi:hypothetical protein
MMTKNFYETNAMQYFEASFKLHELAQDIVDWARINTPYWATQQLKPKPSIDHRFIRHYGINSHASVNIHQVIGTGNAAYMSKDWMSLLAHCELNDPYSDIGCLESLSKNPSYYIDSQINRHPTWRLVTFDGGITWYIDGDGNYRTCLARFYLERLMQAKLIGSATVHGICARTIRYDEAMREAVAFIEANHPNYRMDIESNPIHRNDGSNWYMDTHQITVHITDTNYSSKREDAKTVVHSANELLQWVRNREMSWIKRSVPALFLGGK